MRLPFLNKRITPLIPITFVTFLLVLTMAFMVPPTTRIPHPFGSFSILSIVFPLLFILFFGIGTLVFRTRLNGFLLSMFIISALLLRMNDLKHPLFLVILAAFFIALEFYFTQSEQKKKADGEK